MSCLRLHSFLACHQQSWSQWGCRVNRTKCFYFELPRSRTFSNQNAINRLAFPWRHSPDRLARLDSLDDRSGLQATSSSRLVRKTLVARELGVSWIQIIFTGSWERDLAENFAWAFRKGAAGLLSKTFSIPIDTIEIEDESEEDEMEFGGQITIDTTAQTINAADALASRESQAEAVNAYFVQSMMEENLVALYEKVDPKEIQIKMSMKPIWWQFESAFLVPGLTRKHVKGNPSLKGAYQAIGNEFEKSPSVQKVSEMGEKLASETGLSGERSVIAEVSIGCMEGFQVFDALTGEVIQGDDSFEEKEVQHLVRMEMVTTRASGGGRRPGNWTVIDIDDSLEGNVWH